MNSKTIQRTMILVFLLLIKNVANAQNYGPDFTYNLHGNAPLELIPVIELRSHSIRLQHPYEIVIPDTQFGEMVICQLYDSEGEIIGNRYSQTGNRETRVFFGLKEPNASARCAYVGREIN